MFTAKLGNKVVTATEMYNKYISSKESMTDLKFTDPYGKYEMSYVTRAKNNRSEHFRFKAGRPDWYLKKYTTNESTKHIIAKQKIVNILKSQGLNAIDEDYVSFKAERIPDVSVFENGIITEVHEIQLSRITTNEIKDRTNFYINNGVGVVVWYFDKEANWWGDFTIKEYFNNTLEVGYGIIEFFTEEIEIYE